MESIIGKPLPVCSLQDAVEAQHRLVDLAGRKLGPSMLLGGDLGVHPALGRPEATAAVERVLAAYFGTEDAVLTGGAGTGALRALCTALLAPGDRMVVHDAPLYPTTAVTARAMGLQLETVDFHAADTLAQVCRDGGPRPVVLIQHARQRITDRYDPADVIATVREATPGALILTDESYTALRVPAIGVQMGADYAAFSLFKLLGPDGVGCVVGRTAGIDGLRRDLYSGGSQVQGPTALEALRGLIMAPVHFALQSQAVDAVVADINDGQVEGAAQAFVANAQARVAIVILENLDGQAVIEAAADFGAATHPVGAESRYEVLPLFYRLSHTFLADQPDLAARALRINPMWAGPETVLRILDEAIKQVRSVA